MLVTLLSTFAFIYHSQVLMEEKIEQIEKNKTDIITQVKQATGKLKFTLKVGTFTLLSDWAQCPKVVTQWCMTNTPCRG